MYPYLTDSGEKNKTAKGFNMKVVIQNDLRHQDYKQTLFGNNKQLHHKMKTIRSASH